MTKQPNVRFNGELFAKDVRAKRGERSMREIEKEIGIPIATLSRIENGKIPDAHNFGIFWNWLGENPSKYYIILNPDSDDTITTQLRAAQKMSPETAAAFKDLIRAVYEEILAKTSEEERA
jgi:hypothetical protein